MYYLIKSKQELYDIINVLQNCDDIYYKNVEGETINFDDLNYPVYVFKEEYICGYTHELETITFHFVEIKDFFKENK